jgi:hypothetical protein
MGNKIPLKDVQEKLYNNHSGNIKLLEYSGMNKYGKFECLVCGNIWETKAPRDIINGKRHCGNCWNMRRGVSLRMSYDYISSFIKSFGCRLIGGEYKNQKSKLEIQFECGHIFPMIF